MFLFGLILSCLRQKEARAAARERKKAEKEARRLAKEAEDKRLQEVRDVQRLTQCAHHSSYKHGGLKMLTQSSNSSNIRDK